MLHYHDWQIWADAGFALQQFDHMSRTLTVAGELPDGWSWEMLVKVGEAMDVLPLTAVEGGVGITLTAQQLALSGFCTMQLRGRREQTTRHTNVITVFIARSLSGDEQWPTLPTEFSEAERRILAVRDEVEGYTANPPAIVNGSWWLWNGTEYADSGVTATGYTPQRGVDYCTEADKAEMVAAVAAALPVYNGEVEDA